MQWGAPPSQLPVPAAANAIVAFHPGLKKIHSNAELKLVASWQQRLGAGGAAGACVWGACRGRHCEPDSAVQAAVPFADGHDPLLPPATPAEMRPGSRKSFKGVCVTRWLNSDRPLPQQPQPQDAAAAAAAAQQQQAGQQPS